VEGNRIRAVAGLRRVSSACCNVRVSLQVTVHTRGRALRSCFGKALPDHLLPGSIKRSHLVVFVCHKRQPRSIEVFHGLNQMTFMKGGHVGTRTILLGSRPSFWEALEEAAGKFLTQSSPGTLIRNALICSKIEWYNILVSLIDKFILHKK